MLRRKWLCVFAIGGCLVSAGASAQQAQKTQGRATVVSKTQKKPAFSTDDAESIKNDVKRIASALESVGTQERPKDQMAREESDLRAQWEMAKWATVMAVISFAQLLIGGVGVFLLERHLKKAD